MKTGRFAIPLLLAVAFGSSTLHGAYPLKHTRSAYPAVDNSRENALLARVAAPTADDQSNVRSDRLTAARLRRVIVTDDTLTTYGHNIKIIVAHGRIDLEGPVRSEDERSEIEFDAASVVPSGQIRNKITVAP